MPHRLPDGGMGSLYRENCRLTASASRKASPLRLFKRFGRIPDSQGRIMLTAGLRAYAGIEKNVVIIGLGSYIEIWAEDAWNAENEETSADEINDIMLALNF
jgi:MraZ protein